MIYAFMLCGRETWCERFVDDIKIENKMLKLLITSEEGINSDIMVKLNEIMPVYNKLFDALDGWTLFTDGEEYSRILEETKQESSTDSATKRSRFPIGL